MSSVKRTKLMPSDVTKMMKKATKQTSDDSAIAHATQCITNEFEDVITDAADCNKHSASIRSTDMLQYIKSALPPTISLYIFEEDVANIFQNIHKDFQARKFKTSCKLTTEGRDKDVWTLTVTW